MFEKAVIDHNNCGTPDCCQTCDTAIVEETPTNVVGGTPSLTDPTDAYALQRDSQRNITKKRIAAKVAAKILRRKKV